jgi:hypothetical protein
MKNVNWHSLYYDNVPSCLKNSSPLGGSYNYAYYLLHPHRYFIELFDNTKWFIQRGYRGYADCDVWSIDWHLTEYMPKALRDLRDQVHGTPLIDTGRPSDWENPDTLTMEEWKATIDRLAQTFVEARKLQDMDYTTIEDITAARERVKKGLDMFNEYFFNLWD